MATGNKNQKEMNPYSSGGYGVQDMVGALPDFWRFMAQLEGRPVTGGNKGSYANPDLTPERVQADRQAQLDTIQSSWDRNRREQEMMDQQRQEFLQRRAQRDEAFRRSQIVADPTQWFQETRMQPSGKGTINGMPSGDAILEAQQTANENGAIDSMIPRVQYPWSGEGPRTDMQSRTMKHQGFLERNQDNPYFQKYMQDPNILAAAGGRGGSSQPPAAFDSERDEGKVEDVPGKVAQTYEDTRVAPNSTSSPVDFQSNQDPFVRSFVNSFPTEDQPVIDGYESLFNILRDPEKRAQSIGEHLALMLQDPAAFRRRAIGIREGEIDPESHAFSSQTPYEPYKEQLIPSAQPPEDNILSKIFGSIFWPANDPRRLGPVQGPQLNPQQQMFPTPSR